MTGMWGAPPKTGGSATPTFGVPVTPLLGAALTSEEAKQVALGHLTRSTALAPYTYGPPSWTPTPKPADVHPSNLVDEDRITAALQSLGYPKMVGARRTHTKSNVLRLLFDLPALERPTSLAARKRLAEVLESNPLMVNRAAYSLLHETRTTPLEDTLFEGWTAQELDALTRLPACHAQTWGWAAASCYPTPHPKQVAAFKRQVASLSSHPKWVGMASRLVDALIACECEGTTSTPYVWGDIVDLAAAFPDAPLGGTTWEVEERLRSVLPQFVPVPSMPVLASMLLEGH